MSSDQANLPDHIRRKFPHLQPLKRTPSLMTVNGIGLRMCGRRDYDKDTQTYVKTRCVSLLYLPLFALDSYRVADAGSRAWYFFGREPLSVFARSGNVIVACLLVLLGLGIGWGIHTSSPEYRAEQEMKRAAALRQSGQPLAAAGIYRDQLGGPAAARARPEFQEAIEASLQSGQPQTAAGALRLLAALPAGVNRPEPIVPDVFRRGLALVEKFRAADPEGALDILNNAAAFAPTNSSVPSLRIDLLKQTIAANPDRTNRVVELALAYEGEHQLEECWKLLRPYQHRLGATEGARILGQKLLQEGVYADAYDLLFPYVQTRLDRLHGVEASFTNISARVSERAFEDLKQGRADPSFYNRYDAAASKQDKAALVDDYLESRRRSDPGYQRAVAALKEANQIVPVALDLGVVQLNRAQGLADPAARKAELEAAERTFLAIRSFAGEENEYRMFLGQVYYWLGKSKEGRELFDQLLAANRRAYPVLMALAGTLREVGEKNQARQLCEEAYKAATTNADRFSAAGLRARLESDNDDEIAWLEKCDPDEPSIQIELNSARGEKALRDGNRELAAQNFRNADAGYEKLPRSPATLNNHGLACLNLYRITGNIEDHNRGLALLEEAVSLSPGNSLLLMNTTHLLFARAYIDVVGDAIRFGVLRETPDPGMLRFLYADEAGRQQVYQRLQEDDYFKKAMVYLDKTLLLSPKNPNPYQMSAGVQSSLRNLAELQKLQQRLKVASPDLTEIRRDTLEVYSGAREQEHLAQLQKEIQRLQTLLATAEVKNHPLTFEFARVTLGNLQLEVATCGVAVDGAKLLAEARAAYEQHADTATLNALIDACFCRADQELRVRFPDYARLGTQTRRVLPPRFLMTLLLERDDAVAGAIRTNANVIKAVELIKEDGRLFPSFQAASDWALLRAMDVTGAAALSRQLQADAVGRLAGQMGFELNPVSAAAVLEQRWTQQMLGDEKRAAEIYQAGIRDGVPLPQL